MSWPKRRRGRAPKLSSIGFNTEVRNLAKEAAASGGAVNENLSKALREAAAGAAGMQKELKSLQTKPLRDATNDDRTTSKNRSTGWANLPGTTPVFPATRSSA